MRRRVCITVSDQIIAFLEENDIQKSAFFEAAALFFIAHLKAENVFSKILVGPRGFEPRTSRLSGCGTLTNGQFEKCEHLKKLLWEKERLLQEWQKWGMQHLSKKTLAEYENALKRLTYEYILQNRDKLSKNERLALRSLMKFTYEVGIISDEEYEQLKRCIQLKRTSIDTRIYTDMDIINILKKVSYEKHRLFLRLLIESGLRRSHAIEAWNKIVTGQYIQHGDFVEVKLDIEHNTKRAFICLCSSDLAEKIYRLGEEFTLSAAENLAKKKSILYNGIRKWWYTTARDTGMDADVADFIQGRFSTRIGVKHYLDVHRLALKQYPAILQEIQSRIYNHLK